jgi:hypothetical protein
MRRLPVLILLASFALSAFSIIACRDEDDPEDNLELMYDRPWREHALQNLNEIFSETMQENDNNLQDPEVQKLIDILVPGLVKGYNEFTRDKFNRQEIIKLLAQMEDERSVSVFLDALTLENTSESSTFQTAANAIRRQKVEEALPKLIEAYEMCVQSRDRRPGAPFTNHENVIVQSVISSSIAIVAAHPDSEHKDKVVQMLIDITSTSDLLQELRLNMKAMKGLGRIGDPAAIPVLIRGIAMKGERQPVGLGQIAFASLQQIQDRDAVVDAMLKFARREDEAFNEAYKEEMKNDPAMKNPTWYIQQTTSFLGDLRYRCPKVIEFLESELEHEEPDEIDEKASKIEGLPVNFAPDGWATMRRNWAAVALAEMAHKPLLDVIKKRMVFEKDGKKKVLQLQAEEAVGYVRSLGLLAYPEESCGLLLEVGRAGDDSMRDKTYYNAALMCGKKFLEDMQKSIDKIDCDQIVADRFPDGASEEEERQARNECDVMKKRIEGYMARIEFGEKCGANLDCYLEEIGNHQSKNIERSIVTAYRYARDDESVRQKVVDTLTENLNNPNKVALQASIRSLDLLTPKGSQDLIDKIKKTYAEFAGQSTYKDRARMLQAFIGHVRNRMREAS